MGLRVSPVLVNAEMAVKKASKKFKLLPGAWEAGKVRIPAPIKVMNR